MPKTPVALAATLSLIFSAIVGLSFASSTASAMVMFLNGNNPQPDEENILFSGGSGTTVTGTTNQSNTSVNFMSTTTQTLIASSVGQAKVTTTDNSGLLTSIDVSSPLHFFKDFIANPQASGPFTVKVTTNDGTFTDNLSGGPGNNFITMVALGNEVISSVAFTSTAGFDAFSQPRISGLDEVPTPAALPLMLTGLGVLGYMTFHKRRKAAA